MPTWAPRSDRCRREARWSSKFERNGEKQRITVTLGKRPPPAERRFEQFGPVDEPLPPPSSDGPSIDIPKTDNATPRGPAPRQSLAAAALAIHRAATAGPRCAWSRDERHGAGWTDDRGRSAAVAPAGVAVIGSWNRRRPPNAVGCPHSAGNGRGSPPFAALIDGRRAGRRAFGRLASRGGGHPARLRNRGRQWRARGITHGPVAP